MEDFKNKTGQEMLKHIRGEMQLIHVQMLIAAVIGVYGVSLMTGVFGIAGFFYMFLSSIILFRLIFEEKFRWLRNFRGFMKPIIAFNNGKMFKSNLSDANKEGFKELIIEKATEYKLVKI